MKGMDIKMIKAGSKECGFGNNLYFSVFVGVCESEELLNEYLGQQRERSEIGLMRSWFGKDFNIKYYDNENLVFTVNAQMSKDVDEIFSDAEMFDLKLLKQEYSDYLDRDYNAVILVRGLKYEGKIQEIWNDKFGYFKFLGTYPVAVTDNINDYSEMDKYAINKLVDWGYKIFVTNEDREDFRDDFYLKSHFIWRAEKNGKIFSALDPLRLLGIVTIVQEYGDAWNHIDIPSSFSITQP